MTRDEINAFGEAIKAQLLEGDGAILVAVGANHATDTNDGLLPGCW